MTTNYIKLSNNLESLKLFTIKENLPNYIDMINAGEKSTVDALYELTEKEMDLKEKEPSKPVCTQPDFHSRKQSMTLIFHSSRASIKVK